MYHYCITCKSQLFPHPVTKWTACSCKIVPCMIRVCPSPTPPEKQGMYGLCER